MKTILERINECPNNMVDILELRQPVSDYISAILELFAQKITDKETTDKTLTDVETAYRNRVIELRQSLLN